MAAIAIGLSFTPMDEAAVFRNSAWVQAFPIVAGVVLATLQEGRFSLAYMRYGAFVAWFALMAVAAGSPLKREKVFRGPPSADASR